MPREIVTLQVGQCGNQVRGPIGGRMVKREGAGRLGAEGAVMGCGMVPDDP